MFSVSLWTAFKEKTDKLKTPVATSGHGGIVVDQAANGKLNADFLFAQDDSQRTMQR